MQRLRDVYQIFLKFCAVEAWHMIVMFGNGSRLLVQRVMKTDMLPTCCAMGMEGCFDAYAA